ncbi:3',5'-cyclic-nucleotide phosphodiesterase [Lecanora helva]
MDSADYHVVYVDSRVSRNLDGKLIQNSSPSGSQGAAVNCENSWEDRNPECLKSILGEIEEVRSNLRSVLSVFHGVHTCMSGDTCMAKVTHLDSLSNNTQPVLVMLGTPSGNSVGALHGELSKSALDGSDPSAAYGLTLLQQISSEISTSSLSKFIVPVAMIYKTESETISGDSLSSSRPSRPSSGGFNLHARKPSASPRRRASKDAQTHPKHMLRCIDLGAVDVLTSPLDEDRLRGLSVPAYRAHKEALQERAKFLAQKRIRKRSWLGNTDDKPHAYLREAMVSGLMTGICNPDEVPQIIDHKRLPNLDIQRESRLTNAVGSWGFSGHDWSEEELIHAALIMLQHALTLPELEKWRMSPAELKTFLMASRAAYNDFVNYHNFRHVIDVMQAVFYFLIQLEALPPYPSSGNTNLKRTSSPIATLLTPFDALTLLITAIGHDVGHPGVNNAFLVALNAPLAQLYNDRSVLEAFHCAAYSQILRRYWKTAFEDVSMRGLMINSILATDMSLHFNYMKDLGNLQDKVHDNHGIDGWSPQTLSEYRVLTCALLVKCADISNVARPFEVAVKWADILQHEFANQGVMEKDVGIPTTLFGGPPELGNLVKLGNSQNSFMNIFARPLFEAVTDIMPAMEFAVSEMKANQEIWTGKIKLEMTKQELRGSKLMDSSDEMLSPRSSSPNRTSSQPELSHPEGLPASHPVESSPLAQAAQTEDETRRASISSIPPHLASYDGIDSSRRTSLTHPLSQINTNPDSTSYSRRSSGASPSTAASHPVTIARRLNNSSPSQLQLAPTSDSGSRTVSSNATVENRHPTGRASEDTLSYFSATANVTGESRRNSRGSVGGDISRRGSSKGNDTDYLRSNRFAANAAATRPYDRSVHHRSSSGAHTNNTNASQSTPYSPTGTQATSVLTMDSDEKSSQSRIDSLTSPDQKGIPTVVNVERPGSGHHYGNSIEATKDEDIRTSVIANGSLRSTHSHSRVIGRKASRSIFNFWKKRKSTEASP